MKTNKIFYKYDNIGNGVSVCTIQLDIQNMRSDKLGANAPIMVKIKNFLSKNATIKSLSILGKKKWNTVNDLYKILTSKVQSL